MQTILVTGGAGFIGSCFVRDWLGCESAKVVNYDALTYAGNLDSLESVAGDARYEFVHGDIRNGDLFLETLRRFDVGAVVNFAAESHVDRSIEGPGEFAQTNVVGTLSVLESSLKFWSELPDARREAFRFLHVSTDEVYGSLGAEGLFREETPYQPNSPYAASKASSDHFVRAFHHTYGLPVLLTNCSNNYGPNQFPEKLIPLMILNALEGKPLPVYGDGANVRDWLYVEDHCQALRLVLKTATIGETYNIGGNCEKSNLEVVHEICQAVESLRPDLSHRPLVDLITFVSDRPGHDQRYAIDASKIKRELGWTPTRSFSDGLQRTVKWYLDNPRWVERITSGSYQRERLGLSIHSR